MKKISKLIAFVLVLVLGVILVACGVAGRCLVEQLSLGRLFDRG